MLTVTQMLRKKGVVGKFVEFYGPGLAHAGARRHGDDCQHGAGIWRDLRLLPGQRRDHLLSQGHGAAAAQVALVEKYAKAQGMLWTPKAADPEFTDTLSLDLATVVPSMAGPKRPQDRVTLPMRPPALPR